jgi:hypothetical protein
MLPVVREVRVTCPLRCLAAPELGRPVYRNTHMGWFALMVKVGSHEAGP